MLEVNQETRAPLTPIAGGQSFGMPYGATEVSIQLGVFFHVPPRLNPTAQTWYAAGRRHWSDGNDSHLCGSGTCTRL